MPGRPWLRLYIFKDVGRMIPKWNWQLSRTVYTAAGMLLLAAVLTTTVVGGIKYSSSQGSLIAKPPQQEAPVPPVVVTTGPKVEAPAVKPEGPPAKPASAAAPPDHPGRMPIKGAVKLDFGWQVHPVFNDWRYHTGIDYAAPEGTVVVGAWSGRVSEVYRDPQYGLTVAVTSGQYTVYYSALGTAAVEKEKLVGAGDKIGTVGTANTEPYPHLHLAIKKSDKFVNPLELMGKSD